MLAGTQRETTLDRMLFADASTFARTLVVGLLAYVGLVLLLRVSGRRTLSKMNAFDFVVTVALGSTLATILLDRNVSLAQGLLALGLLIAMQFAVTWSSVRTRWVRRLVTGEPALLVHRGAMLPGALRHARVTEDEVHAALRAAGVASVADVEAVVLETDGSFSVIRTGAGSGPSSLDGVSTPHRGGKIGDRL
jgi:uncharacterized membrane protein YcaP (DUF421 family)